MKNVRKLMLLLSGCLVFSLAMPVFAQDAGTQQAPQAQTKDTKAEVKDTKAEGTTTQGKTTKSKKTSKSKKTDEKKTDEAPKQ